MRCVPGTVTVRRQGLARALLLGVVVWMAAPGVATGQSLPDAGTVPGPAGARGPSASPAAPGAGPPAPSASDAPASAPPAAETPSAPASAPLPGSLPGAGEAEANPSRSPEPSAALSPPVSPTPPTPSTPTNNGSRAGSAPVAAPTGSAGAARNPGNARPADTGSGAPVADLERMETAIAYLDEQSAQARLFCVLGDLLLGGFLAGTGVWAATRDDAHASSSDRALMSALALGTGAVFLANAAWCMAHDPNVYAEVHRDFDGAQSAGPLDMATLARFEGELRAHARTARNMRRATGVSFIGVGLGGGAITGLAAAGALEGDARDLGYVVGITYMALGLWQSLVLLSSESEPERVWRAYQRGESPGPPPETQGPRFPSAGVRVRPGGVSGWF